MRNIWNKLEQRVGYRRAKVLQFLFFIGLLGVIIQVLILQRLYSSALLYIFIPYVVAVFIAWFRPYAEPEKRRLGYEYLSNILYALIIFLSTSIILGEGFVCVVFFFPIYIVVVSVYFLFAWIGNKLEEKNNKLLSIATPFLFVFMSLEGATDSLSLPRESFVEVSKVVPLSISEVKQNLAKPFSLEKDRNWMLSILNTLAISKLKQNS